MAKFWELFKKFEEAPNAEVMEAVLKDVQEAKVGTPGLTADARTSLSNWGLRLGMWVSTPEGIGIVTGVFADTVEVMLTDDAGFNKKKQNFIAGSVQQAKLGQIPKARRPAEAHSGY